MMRDYQLTDVINKGFTPEEIKSKSLTMHSEYQKTVLLFTQMVPKEKIIFST